jgi:hypothetical protein
MALRRKVVCGLSGGALAALLAGCSVDSLIWGSDGAKVIEATEKLIADWLRAKRRTLFALIPPQILATLATGLRCLLVSRRSFPASIGRTKQRLIRSGASTWRAYPRVHRRAPSSLAISSSVRLVMSYASSMSLGQRFQQWNKAAKIFCPSVGGSLSGRCNNTRR